MAVNSSRDAASSLALVATVWRFVRFQLPLKWWFAALTALLGGFAGLLGSVYGSDIKGAMPLTLVFEPVPWPVIAFWTSLFLFGAFFGLGFGAQIEATNTLEGRIRTLPPKGFLIAFEDIFSESFVSDSKAVEDSQNAIALTEAIATALTGIAFLAKAFDSRHDRPRYSVNIMLYRPIETVSPDELDKHVLFAEPGHNPDAWQGVLQLQSEFAYSLTYDPAKPAIPDTEVSPIMLPIPKDSYRIDNGKTTVLPGAPTVYCDPTKFAGFENTVELADWCRKHSGLRASIAEEIEKYFVEGAGKNIRSFICMPIVVPKSASNDDIKVLGVINLHSNRESILPGEKGGLFVPLATPFTRLLARSLAKYCNLPSNP